MTKEELETKVSEQCPAMLEHENFMHAAECVFCKGIPNDSGKSLTSDELDAWHKMNTATVAQVIEYLQTNFKPNDKLCYMDCVEGMKNDCTCITKDQLGKRFFYYVKDLKARNMEKFKLTKEQEDDMFQYVGDEDVVVG